MNIKKIYLLVTILFLSLISQTIFAKKMLQLKGSDTILNVSQYLVEEYMIRNPKDHIAVTGGGSGVGISSLINETTDIAMASRNISSKELDAAKAKGLDIEEITIGFDGITLITNKSNPVKDISSENLGKIFRGEITNWKDVGGPNANITVLSRDSSSGTHEFFKEHIVRNGNSKGSEEYGKSVLYMPSNEAIKQQIQANINAIGYIGMGYMDNSVNALKVDSIEPTTENVSTKKYPIARGVFWYVPKSRDIILTNLINFTLSPEGQKIVKEEGFVPIN